MAKSIVKDIKPGYTRSIASSSYPKTAVFGESHTAVITDDIHGMNSVNEIDYGIVKITEKNHAAKISSILPFRVRFTNIGIPGILGAPIGIAIIGYNNYIL